LARAGVFQWTFSPPVPIREYMLRRTVFILLLTLLFLLLLGGFLSSFYFRAVPAGLVQGGLEGKTLVYSKGSPVVLSGEWLLKEGIHPPGEMMDDGVPVSVRGTSPWTAFQKTSFSPAQGTYSYQAVLDIQGFRGFCAVFLPGCNGAYRLFVNGSPVAESGRVAREGDGETLGGGSLVVPFFLERDRIVLDLQVSNHFHYSGGFFHGVPEFGRMEDVSHRAVMVGYRNLMLILALLSITAVFITQALLTRKVRHQLYLGLASFAYALVFILKDSLLLPRILSEISREHLLRGEAVLGLAAVVLLFIHGLRFFRDPAGPAVLWGSRAAGLAGLAGAAAAVALPSSLFWIVQIFHILLGLSLFFCLFPVAYRGLKQHRRLAKPFAVGVLLLVLCCLNEGMRVLGFLPSPGLFWGAFLYYALVELYSLLYQTSQTYTELGGVYQKMEQVVETRNSLLTRVSDEVGSSMEKITDLTHSLIQGALGLLNSDQLVSASLIMGQSLHHQYFLHDVVDYTQLQEEGLELTFGNIKLFPLVNQTIISFGSVLVGQDIVLRNLIPRDFPLLWGDIRRMGQIFYNFLSYGIQNISSGTITLEASPGDKAGNIRLIFQGMDAEHLALATAFLNNEAEQNDEAQGMTILRYRLSRRLVELHGSRLDVEPRDDGLIISFSLPLGDVQAEEEALSEEMAVHLDALENLQPLLEDVESERDVRIMLVSSDSVMLQVMKGQLATMNYKIIPVMKGSDCLSRLEEGGVQMVVIDDSLADMDSHDLCRQIRRKRTSDELPVIMVLRDVGSESMESLTAGANDYLRRPYQQEEFLTRINTHLQLSRISLVYSQFVPKEFLKSLGQENITDVKLGDQVQREMTILFVDIRAFTNLSENMTPQENFKFINSYLSQFTPIITRNNGFVDKFIGDAIMALYPDKPEDAIRTAIEMLEYVKVYNGYRAKCGYRPINIGVGIHTGNLILGIIGDKERMQGTVISDSVNLAARIQDVTKLYHASVVISQETFVKLENPTDFNFRFLGKVKVKGKAKSVSLFEIFNAEDDAVKELKEETKGEFETAILLFAKREFAEAEKLLQEVLARNPNDSTARLFLDRAQKFMQAEKRSFLTSL